MQTTVAFLAFLAYFEVEVGLRSHPRWHRVAENPDQRHAFEEETK
jgi:hypothetical protein